MMLNLKDLEFFQDLSDDDGSKLSGGYLIRESEINKNKSTLGCGFTMTSEDQIEGIREYHEFCNVAPPSPEGVIHIDMRPTGRTYWCEDGWCRKRGSWG